MKENRGQFEVAAMCDALDVQRSGYYAWEQRPPCARLVKQAGIVQAIRACHEASARTYGSPRIHEELKEREIDVCLNTVAKLMRNEGIHAASPGRFAPCTTDSNHDSPIAPNRLDRDFTADGPNRKWCCDITYIVTGVGFMYLSVVMDLFSRKIVGWSMDTSLKAEGCLRAIRMAIAARAPGAGLLHHSDRGVQYASGDYAGLLSEHGITMSMSGKGNCWDNAAMESFFATLKKERVNRERYGTIEQASRSVFEYIECWYNRRRRHSSIGYQSPEEFEAGRN